MKIYRAEKKKIGKAKKRRIGLKKIVVIAAKVTMLLMPIPEIVGAQTGPPAPRNTLWKTTGAINNVQLDARNCWGAFCGPTIVLALTITDLFVGTRTASASGGFVINILILIVGVINIGIIMIGIDIAKKIPKKFDREENYTMQFFLFIVFLGAVFLVDRAGAGLFGLV